MPRSSKKLEAGAEDTEIRSATTPERHIRLAVFSGLTWRGWRNVIAPGWEYMNRGEIFREASGSRKENTAQVCSPASIGGVAGLSAGESLHSEQSNPLVMSAHTSPASHIARVSLYKPHRYSSRRVNCVSVRLSELKKKPDWTTGWTNSDAPALTFDIETSVGEKVRKITHKKMPIYNVLSRPRKCKMEKRAVQGPRSPTDHNERLKPCALKKTWWQGTATRPASYKTYASDKEDGVLIKDQKQQILWHFAICVSRSTSHARTLAAKTLVSYTQVSTKVKREHRSGGAHTMHPTTETADQTTLYTWNGWFLWTNDERTLGAIGHGRPLDHHNIELLMDVMSDYRVCFHHSSFIQQKMSETLSAQTIEDLLEAFFQQACIDYATTALLTYYVALNLPHDLRRLWGRRSIATLLSAINWLAIIGTIFTSMPFLGGTAQVWDIHSLIVVAALRVHAMSRGNWHWVLPVWLLGMVPVGTNIWILTQETWLFIPQLLCMDMVDVYRNVLVDAPTRDVVTIVTRGSVVVSDTLVVAATWYYISRTSSVRTQLVRDMWAVRPTLTTVMFRDGTLYFL
ncbi:predicted protein [Postia placenta Mad-698-R]|nr:predicted protein [Postia placenta Mad-698-R]